MGLGAAPAKNSLFVLEKTGNGFLAQVPESEDFGDLYAVGRADLNQLPFVRNRQSDVCLHLGLIATGLRAGAFRLLEP